VEKIGKVGGVKSWCRIENGTDTGFPEEERSGDHGECLKGINRQSGQEQCVQGGFTLTTFNQSVTENNRLMICSRYGISIEAGRILNREV
jgi:hypothetical protein